MKKTTILYWIFTGLFAAFMIFSSIPDANAVKFIGSLGYPAYFDIVISIAKPAGIIALLVPGFKPDMRLMLLSFGSGALSYVFFTAKRTWLLQLKTFPQWKK